MSFGVARFWLRCFSVVTVSVLLGITLSFSATPDIQPAWAGNAGVCEPTGGTAHNNLKVYPSHGKVFYIDSGQGQSVDAAYAGYRVEDTSGSTRSNLWAKVDTFTGGVVGLANERDAYFRIGEIGANQTLPAYFLLTAGSSTTSAQSHVFRVYSGDPRLSGSSELYNCTYSFVSVKETIKASANKVTDVTTVVSNQIGGNLVVTVKGQTGTIGSGTSSPDGEVLWFTPAARSSWPSSSLSLRSTSIKFATNNALNQNLSTHVSKLVFVNPKSTLLGTANRYYYEATYTFRITGPVPSSVQAIPIAQISSGTQIKHTDVTDITSDAGATVSITTPVNVGVAKTVSPTIDTSGGTEKLSYTVSFTNSSGGSVDLDQIVDEPSAGLSFTAGSASFGGSSVADPVTDSSGNLVFQGPFTVSSGASETLTYMMTSSCTTPSFDYTNVAYGTIGSLVVGKNGTTVSGVRITGSCPPATGSVTVSDQTLDPVPITQPASVVAETSATLNGSIDPNGVAGQAVTFVWGTSSSLAGGATVTLSTSTSSSDFYAVSTPLTGLSSGTRYYYQVTIGGIAGEILSFVTTEAVGTPTIDTDPVSGIDISSGSVTFNGTVDPNQVAGGATVYFVYGLTGSSGASTDCSTVSPYGSPILVEADTDDDGLFDDGAEIFQGAFPATFSTSVTGLTTGAYYCVYARTTWSSGTVTLNDTTPVLFRMNTMYTQTITFPTPSITSYNATETLLATVADPSGGSALTVTYGSNTPSVCTVSGGVVTIVGAGTCSLTAYQTGDDSRYPAAPVTVTFTVTSYTVIYDLNGAAGSAPVDSSSPYAAGQNVTVTATVPSRTGYSFTGWDTLANGAGTDYATSSTLSSIAANTTLYAQWAAATTYTVTYSANGGTGAPSTSTHNQGTTVTVSATEPTRTGYRFVDWRDAGNVSYAPSASLGSIAGNVVLTAQWVQTFTVTYDANSATSGSVPGVTTHDTGATVTVASNSGPLVRTGYTFAGWNTQAGGGGTTYLAGSGTFTIAANTTLYAQWTANPPASSGGGSGSSSSSPSAEPTPPNLVIPRFLPPRSVFRQPVSPQREQNVSATLGQREKINEAGGEAKPAEVSLPMALTPGLPGFGTIDFGAGIEPVGAAAGSLELAQRTVAELANESLRGFAPGSSAYIEIVGSRTGARFVVTDADVIDRFTLVRTIRESIEAQRADFFSIESAQAAEGPVIPAQWTIDEKAEADYFFAAAGLPAPALLSDFPIGQYSNWVFLETRASTFVPGSTVYLTLTSQPVVLATGVVGLDGEIELSGTVPAELLTVGEHRVRIVGTRALEGASVDGEGEIQVSDTLLQEIQRFDLGTQSTISFFGSGATGETHVALRVIPLVPSAPWWALIFIGLGLVLFGSLRRWGPTRKNFVHNVAAVIVFLMATPAVILGWISTVTTVVWWALALGLVAMVLYYLVRPKHPVSRESQTRFE